MPLDIVQLAEQHEGYDKIPNDLLYQYLTERHEDLVNESRLGVERIPNSILGKEVRRRCKTDLMWMARYFTWSSNPISENGIKPFVENIFDDEFYGSFTKLFVQKDDSKPLNKQSELKTRLLLWPRGGAKALDVNTLLPTPDGFQTMGSIEVGDVVYGEDGSEVAVIGTSGIFYDRPCYEVTFSSGEKIIADEGHLWLTDARRDRENKPRTEQRGSPSPTVKTTKQIADTLFCRKERNHRVSVAEPIQGREIDLPIPPYVLGCWLGDGTSSSASLTCDEADSQIVEEIRNEGVPVTKTPVYLRWAFNGGKDHPDFKKHKSGFCFNLKKLGVFRNKHIPDIYLRASYQQRLSLLQGLMDTDGTISPEGKCYFGNTNERLAYQTKELIASLGLKPSITKRKAVLYGREISDSFLVCFKAYSDQPVFRLNRKKQRQVGKAKTSLQNHRTIVSVDPVVSRPVKCIMVDSPTHLYLAGEGFIPTHNSTFDHVDTVQWILNFPSIRILYMTAAADLAEGFVGEIKGHFYIKEDPSPMNLFFPEFCVEEGKAGAKYTFTCPVYAAKKTGRKEPTVYASSVGKNKAGWRYELIKADDAVSDKNSESSEQCETISSKLFLAEKLLALGGHYIDYIGTRYADEDHYGKVLEQNENAPVVEKGVGWELIENPATSTKILIGRAIQIKPEVVQKLENEGKPVTYQEAGEENCILLLPHLMPFKWCLGDFTKNEKSFEGQRNQNPRPASELEFTRLLMLQSTVPYSDMPQVGVVSQVWDFAFSKKKGADFTTGCSIMWAERDEVDKFTGQKTGQKITVGYIQEIVRERFNHLTLARAVVDLAEKYRPFVVGVENAAGSNLLTEQIRAEAFRKKNSQVYATCSNIDWFAPDNQKDAKKVRMRSTYPWFVEGRLKLFNACFKDKEGQINLEPVYNEFEKCLTSHHHDDIPDVIAMQLRYAPRAYQAIVENNEEAMVRMEDGYNLIFEENVDPFGRIGFGPPTQSLQVDVEIFDDYTAAEAPDGMDPILGAGLWG